MTVTVGYWCDECRRKYVQHMCKGSLPCGHDILSAIWVRAQQGKEWEEVSMVEENYHFSARVTLIRKEDSEIEPGVYPTSLFRFKVVGETDEVDSQTWLAGLEPRFIRAFLNRWESRKEAPDWVRLLNFFSNDEVKADAAIEQG